MAFIKVIAPAEADDELGRAYAAWVPPKRRNVRIPAAHISQIFSLRPALMETAGLSFQTMWGGTLARTTKEMIAVTVSKATKCHY